jgi:hypothetical protein
MNRPEDEPSVKAKFKAGGVVRNCLSRGSRELLLVLLVALPALVQANNFTYTTNNGGLIITGYSGPGVFTVPASFGGLPVIAVGDNAFRYREDIVSVSISEGIQAIGTEAFYLCKGLTNVTLPNSLTNIGRDAFNYCSGLLTITVPNAAISASCFFGCSSLVSATLGQGVREVGAAPFFDCTGLQAVTVDPLNPNYISTDGVLFDFEQSRLIQYPGGRVGSYAVSGGVLAIGEHAFAVTPGLTSITIPASVTNLGSGAFYFCQFLTNATFGSGLISFGRNALAYCSRLTAIEMPDTVTVIGDGAFTFCAGLTNVLLSAQLVSIGERAFSSCAQLPSITIPGTVVSIGTSAFSGCDRLTTMEVHGGITNVGDYVFAFCKNLASATGFEGITVLGDSWFNGCRSLTNVTFNPHITSIETGAFEACSSLRAFVVPDAVTNIGDFAFTDSGLTNVAFGSNVASIGFSAFSGCPMANITLPDSFINLGDRAFYDCPNLATVNIPRNLTSLGYEAFYACPKLTAFTVDPANPALSSVDGVLFDKNRAKLVQFPAGKGGDYAIPEGVRIIATNAFLACSALTSVVFPASLVGIQAIAFNLCPNLTALFFLGNAPGVGAGALSGATNAIVYYLPATTGWGPSFGGRPTRLWNPQILTGAADFGVLSNQFGFTMTGSSGLVVVVEAGTNLASPAWYPAGTNTLTDGSSYFSDGAWTNYPARFYRLRPP